MIQYYEAAWHCQVTFSGIFFGSGSCFLHLDSAACLFSFLRSGCWALFLPPFRPAFRRNSVTALLVVWLVFDFIRFSCCWIALARHLLPFPGAWIALARHLPPSPAPGSVIRRVLRGLGAPGLRFGFWRPHWPWRRVSAGEARRVSWSCDGQRCGGQARP